MSRGKGQRAAGRSNAAGRTLLVRYRLLDTAGSLRTRSRAWRTRRPGGRARGLSTGGLLWRKNSYDTEGDRAVSGCGSAGAEKGGIPGLPPSPTYLPRHLAQHPVQLQVHRGWGRQGAVILLAISSNGALPIVHQHYLRPRSPEGRRL